DNVGGNVNVLLGRANYFSVRGGSFFDKYQDTGIPATTSYTYQTPTTGVAGIPASLQGGQFTTNTPRAQITNRDITKQAFIQLDYNHAFNAVGAHLVKGG